MYNMLFVKLIHENNEIIFKISNFLFEIILDLQKNHKDNI